MASAPTKEVFSALQFFVGLQYLYEVIILEYLSRINKINFFANDNNHLITNRHKNKFQHYLYEMCVENKFHNGITDIFKMTSNHKLDSTISCRVMNCVVEKPLINTMKLFKGAYGDKCDLHQAVKDKNIDFVKMFLTTCEFDLNLTNQCGKTLLYLAAAAEDEDMVKLLVSAGADINFKNIGGDTALHHVVRCNNVNLIEYLIYQGADVNVRNNIDITPLHWAAFYNINDSHLVAAELLLANGADVNAQDSDGDTPLHHFLFNDQTNADMIKLFFHYRVDVNIKNKDGDTPLNLALTKNNFLVCEYLTAIGADSSVKNKFDNTSLNITTERCINDSSLRVDDVLGRCGSNDDARNIYKCSSCFLNEDNKFIDLYVKKLDLKNQNIMSENNNLLFNSFSISKNTYSFVKNLKSVSLAY